MNNPLAPHPLAWYLAVLRRQWTVVVGFAAALFTVVLVASLLSTRYYASSATIEIREDAPMVLSNMTEVMPTAPHWQLDKFYRTQHWLLASPEVMTEAIRDLRETHGITDFNEALVPHAKLRGMIEIEPENLTHLVTIKVEHPDPDKAALFANAIADAYTRLNLEHQLQASKAALHWLEEQQDVYRERRFASDKALLDYRTEHGTYEVEHQMVTADTLRQLQGAWSDAHTKRVSLEAKTEGLRDQLQAGNLIALAEHIAVPGSVTDTALSAYRRKQQERKVLRARLTETHPDVLEHDRELDALAAQLQEQVEAHISGQEASVRLARSQEEALARRIEEIGSTMAERSEELTPMRFLEQQAERDASFYETLDRRRTEVGLQQYLTANNVRVVDRAEPGIAPVRPNVMLNLAASLLIGVLGGCVLALGVESMNTSVKSREDVEAASGVPLLGTVPLVSQTQFQSVTKEVERNLLAHALPRSFVAECLRTIRTNILFRGDKKARRHLMITSALPKEGKSFFSSNLAAVMAAAGSRVILIDADLRRPSLHRYFGLSNDVGLADVLDGKKTVAEAVQKSHVPGLMVLTAGSAYDRPLEVLNREAVERLLEQVATYDSVLVDTPPVNVVSDALVLASFIESVIFLVSAHSTPKSMVATSCHRLREVNPNLLGAIVNKLDGSGSTYSYNYYYSDYYQYGPPESRRAAGNDG